MHQTHLLKKSPVIFNNCSSSELLSCGLIGGAVLSTCIIIVTTLLKLLFPVLSVLPTLGIGVTFFLIGVGFGVFRLSKTFAAKKVTKPAGYYWHWLTIRFSKRLVCNIYRWSI